MIYFLLISLGLVVGYLGWVTVPSTVWAYGNLSKLAGLLDKMVEQPNQSQPKPGSWPPGQPCTTRNNANMTARLYTVMTSMPWKLEHIINVGCCFPLSSPPPLRLLVLPFSIASNEAKSVAGNHWMRLSPSVALLRGQAWSSLGIGRIYQARIWLAADMLRLILTGI